MILYIVSTPIGNMKDITLRAIETLKEVDIIACEDTRVTKKILSHYEIFNKKMVSYNDKNELASSKGLIALLKEGKTIALVSDAGTPIINDPGFRIVKEAIKEQIKIDIIPGPSSVLTTVQLSNFDPHFKFHGFLKPKSGQRQNQLKKFQPGTHIIFISPHRIKAELADIRNVFGGSVNVFLGKEFTKKFEAHYRGAIKEVIDQLPEIIKGEFSLALEIPKKGKKRIHNIDI